MDIYAESNAENAEIFYPDKSPAERLAETVTGFCDFTDTFLADERNTYYVRVENDAWVSTLRLTDMVTFQYLEALETAPEYRQMGYAEKLFSAVTEQLMQNGIAVIRDSVGKKNTPSKIS